MYCRHVSFSFVCLHFRRRWARGVLEWLRSHHALESAGWDRASSLTHMHIHTPHSPFGQGTSISPFLFLACRLRCVFRLRARRGVVCVIYIFVPLICVSNVVTPFPICRWLTTTLLFATAHHRPVLSKKKVSHIRSLIAKRKWWFHRYRRGESNPRPSPCKGDIITTRLLLLKSTLIGIFLLI